MYHDFTVSPGKTGRKRKENVEGRRTDEAGQDASEAPTGHSVSIGCRLTPLIVS